MPGVGDPGVRRYRHKRSSGESLETWGGPLTVPGYLDGVEAVTSGDNGKAYLVGVPPRPAGTRSEFDRPRPYPSRQFVR